MKALLTHENVVISLHSDYTHAVSAWGRYMVNLSMNPFLNQHGFMEPKIVELHTIRYIGNVVPENEFTLLPDMTPNASLTTGKNVVTADQSRLDSGCFHSSLKVK